MTIEHTVFRNKQLFCLNCGGSYTLNYPIPVADISQKVEYFNGLHRDCPKTWEEPSADQSKTVEQKALWWIANGHIGQSSKTMWLCFMNQKEITAYHPYDPDDFSRCYKLLEAVPEWKTQLGKLKSLSPQWSNLVDNWTKLTEMYELNVKQEWKNSKKIGMYDFMEKLLNQKEC